MLLGKRARHPMKRTTSMTDFSYDDLSVVVHPPMASGHHMDRDHSTTMTTTTMTKVMGFVSPRGLHRRNSADFVLTSNSTTSTTFLRSCAFCSCRLAPGRDIFMYRGDSAFCSLECRQQQMTQDEWKEKCTKESHSSSSHPTPVPSTKGESIAAL